MNRKTVWLSLVATIALLAMISTVSLAAQQSQDVLKPGTYSAKVKAIVCGGCGPLIKQTLEKMKEIDAVSVDTSKITLQFTVNKDSTVKLSDVQKALKVAADQMKMGADYTLSDVKPTK